MNVLLVSPVGEDGGGERVLLSLARHLPAHGHRVRLACMRPGPLVDIARAAGVETIAYRPHRYRDVSAVLGGARWLRRATESFGADILHFNHTAFFYLTLASRPPGCRVVWHLHDAPARRDFLGPWLRRARADHVVFTTDAVRAGFPRLARGPWSVIAPTCVEPNQLRALPVDLTTRDRLGLPAGEMFLTVARLQPHKGHRHLIEAAALVLRQRPDICFAIVGKAAAIDAPYEAALRAEVDARGLAENVKFLDYVSQADLANLYRAATAVVHPAVSEGFGLVLLEAMAYGRPVIAAAADGPCRVIRPEIDGLLVPTGDGAALANALLRLLDDPALAARLASGAAARADGFDAAAMTRSINTIYQGLQNTAQTRSGQRVE